MTNICIFLKIESSYIEKMKSTGFADELSMGYVDNSKVSDLSQKNKIGIYRDGRD